MSGDIQLRVPTMAPPRLKARPIERTTRRETKTEVALGEFLVNTASRGQQVRLREVLFRDRSRGAEIGTAERGGRGVGNGCRGSEKERVVEAQSRGRLA